MTAVRVDGVGHETNTYPRGDELTAAAVSTTTAGTIAGTTAAGAAPTITIPNGMTCTDRRGTFNLNPVTGGGAQAAGDVATVRFAEEYAATPHVILSCEAITDPDDNIICVASDVNTQGFNVLANAALTTAETYRITYLVVP
jgi:hypothetical protein